MKNKSYQGKRRNNQFRKNNKSNRNKSSDTSSLKNVYGSFPPPTILQEYEYASAGAADKILDMVKAEQARRHEIEDDILYDQRKTKRIGQLFTLITIIIVVISTVSLAMNGKDDVAIILCSTCFAAISITSIFGNSVKKYNSAQNRKK